MNGMTSLDLLLAISLLTSLLMLGAGNLRAAGWLAVVLYGIQMSILTVMGIAIKTTPAAIVSNLHISILGNSLHWSMTGLGWFFAVITVAAALLTTWFAAGAWSAQRHDRRIFHTAMALNVFAMLLLLSSGDLLSLFIGWELVSWASYLMMAQRGGAAIHSALRYILYATAGAVAILAGMLLIQSKTGALDYASVRNYLAAASPALLWMLMLLFASGFLIKMAAVPFHLWQAKAYSLTPGPGAAFLGAISSRMGLFGLAIVLVSLIGPQRLLDLSIPYTFLNARELWMWVAAITIVVPTFIALTQSDARMLLAWHGIGQGGYMLIGILVGSPLGVAGGLMHVINHASYQAALFLAVTAVAYRTGTADLDRLGGLVTRMPLSFVTMLLGIIGLAGLPPMNGFVSKWMVYKSLLDSNMPLLFLATVIGTLGTILSVYKLIHNTFLGQLRLEHEAIREVPPSMTIPMLLLGAIAFITGYLPGLALDLVAPAQAFLKVAPLSYSLGGINHATGNLNMLWVVSILIVSIGIGALIFFAGNRSSRVHQFDNYAGGHFLSADMRYHYSHNFYAGLMRVIGPWYRGSIQWLESGLVSLSNLSASVSVAMYRNTYVSYYLLLTVIVMLLWVIFA
jgi:formate hydrogenlyase subunit 3/multisubunit Na+/H+ antiporter MnhD subunit